MTRRSLSIKFQLQLTEHYKILIFNMLITRLGTNIIARINAFCTSSKVDSIHFKILDFNRWDQFSDLLHSEGDRLTPEVLTSTSRHIINLINRFPGNHLPPKSFLALNKIVKAMEQVDLSQQDLRSIANLLTLLRHFSKKGFSQTVYNVTKNRLCDRFVELLSNRQFGQIDVSELLFGYYELVYFKNSKGCSLIVKHILHLVQQQSHSRGIFSISQLTLLMHMYSVKGDLTNKEEKLRSYVLATLAEKASILRLNEVVSMVVNLKKMDDLDMSHTDKSNVLKIGNTMLENISQLEEKSTIEYLRTDLYNSHMIFSKINRELLATILAQIEQNGQSQIESSLLFYFLSLLSNQLPFRNLTPEMKQKYHKFILRHTVSIANGQVEDKEIHNYIKPLVTILNNGFFDERIEDELMRHLTIMSENRQLKGSLIEALFNVHFDISPLLKKYLETEPYDLMFKLKKITFLNKLNKSQRYSSFKPAIESQLESLITSTSSIFSSPHIFSDNIKNILRENNDINWYEVHHVFRDSFKEMAIPLRDSQEGTTNQSALYLEYVLKGHRTGDFNEFLENNKDKIPPVVLIRTLQKLMEKDSREVKANRNTLGLIYSQLPSLFEQKQKTILYTALQYMSFCNRYVVIPNYDDQGLTLAFKILHAFIGKIEQVQQLNLMVPFFNVMLRYVNRSNKNYNVDSNYRNLLEHLLRKIDRFSKHRQLVSDIVSHGLRLNLVDAEIAQKIQTSKIKLNFLNQARLNYRLDNTFKPRINNFSSHTLKVVLENHNLLPFVQERIDKVKETIERLYPLDAAEILASFNMPNSNTSHELVKALLSRLITTNNKALRYGVDLVGAINNLQAKKYITINICKQLAEKIIETIGNNHSLFSLESHKAFIKLFAAHRGLQCQKYYEGLLEWVKQHNNRDVYFLLVNLRLTGCSLPPKYHDYIISLIKKQAFQGINTFLAFESQLEQSKRVACVSAYVEGCNANQMKPISKLKYNYLMRHYPEQMNKLQKQPTTFAPQRNISNMPKGNQDAFDALAEHHGVKDYQTTIVDNYPIIQIKQWVIVFTPSNLAGAELQLAFLKKAISEEFPNSEIILLQRCYSDYLMILLNQEAPQLVPSELLKTSGNKKNKEEVVDEESEELEH